MSGETSDKPKPIISGPSQAEGVARFASRTKYEDLTPERREQLKVSVLDALACAVSALGAPPVEACRAQAEEFGGRVGSCALIGGGRSNIVYAAFYNTVLVRYVDYMDSYLAHGGLCHPSDNTAAVLAASEHADLSGKDFLTALAVAYQVDSRLTEAVPFMADGFDLTTPLSFSLAAGVSRALGLEEAKTAAAIGTPHGEGTRRARSAPQSQPRRSQHRAAAPAGMGRERGPIHQHRQSHGREASPQTRRTGDHPAHPRHRLPNHCHTANSRLTAPHDRTVTTPRYTRHAPRSSRRPTRGSLIVLARPTAASP